MIRIIVLLSFLLFLSCKEKEVKVIKVEASEIEIKVAKEDPVDESLHADANMIMGVVIPTANRQWFIKVACPSSEFQDITSLLDKVMETIKFDDYSVEVVTYEVLEGWEVRKSKGYIHSVITKPGLKTKVSIQHAQVADRSFRNKQKQSFLEVVNSWNAQLGNRAIDEKTLSRLCQKKIVNGNFGILFVLVKAQNSGPQQPPRMQTQSLEAMRVAFSTVGDNTWYFKIAGTDQAVNAEKDNFEAFIQSFKAGNPPSWTKAEGWVEGQSGGMIKASYTASGAKVTIIPLGAQSGSLVSNVNRWRGQVGLAAATEAEITDSLKTLKAGSIDFKYLHLTKGTSAPVPPPVEPLSPTKSSPAIRVAFAVTGGKTWYVKLTGPSGTLISQKDNFEKFVQSLKFTDGDISWSAPKGWVAGSSGGMIKASFTVSDSKLTIIPLGAQSGSLVSNVNRWRGQVGLDRLDEAQIKAQMKTLIAGNVSFNYFFLSKNESSPAPAKDPEPAELPKNAQNKVTTSSKVTFTLPSSWKKLAPAGMRKVNLLIGEDVSVTGISLPAIAKGVDRNVARWCGQVGLASPSEADLKKYVSKVDFNGEKADYVVLEGDEKAIIAIIYEFETGVWFFKASGPKAKVMEEKGNFESFMSSIKVGGVE
jgi:hypothetical protein